MNQLLRFFIIIPLTLIFGNLNGQSLDSVNYPAAPYSICFHDLPNSGRAIDSISVKKLLEVGNIECCFDKFEIIEFTLALDGNCIGGSGYGQVTVRGNRWNDTMVRIVKGLRPGNLIFIVDVKAKNKSGNIYLLRSKAIYIKVDEKS
jgi:hypothetical protein